MLRNRTMVGSGCLLFILLCGGFMLLMRACLSRYDERAAILPAIIYEQDTSAVIISLVSFDKTSSYESGRGFTRKTVNTTYYIQSNDLNTAKKIRSARLKDHEDIKEWPVKILGSARGKIWIYLGELMAVDPVSLETIADISKLESLNGGLRGRFPKEQRFYGYNPADKNIYFTATDGSKWMLDSKTYLATAVTEVDPDSIFSSAANNLKQLQVQAGLDEDSLNKLYSHDPYLLFREGKISAAKYQASLDILSQKRTELRAKREQFRAAETSLRSAKQNASMQMSAISTLNRINPGYNQMYNNTDTANGSWTGIYDEKEFKSLDSRYRTNRLYDEAARRSIYAGDMNYEINGNFAYDTGEQSTSADQYLQGGFLLDKNSAKPYRLAGNQLLVVHKDIIGKTGSILVSKVDQSGKRLWTTETGLPGWFDWKIARNKLIIFGQDNKALSGDDANLVLVVDLDSGKKISYDYFTGN